VSIGGIGFVLTSASSRFGRDLLPIGHPAALVWVPQGLVMGLYGVAALLLATYLWLVISIDVGSASTVSIGRPARPASAAAASES
jgi:hypothetical protein